MDLLKPGNPSILTRHLGRLPGGGGPEAVPAKADEGGGLALEGTSKGRRDKPKLGHTQGRQLLPCLELLPPQLLRDPTPLPACEQELCLALHPHPSQSSQ